MNINLIESTARSEKYMDLVLGNEFYFWNKLDIAAATRVGSQNYNNEMRISKTLIDHVISDLKSFEFTFSNNSSHISDH